MITYYTILSFFLWLLDTRQSCIGPNCEYSSIPVMKEDEQVSFLQSSLSKISSSPEDHIMISFIIGMLTTLLIIQGYIFCFQSSFCTNKNKKKSYQRPSPQNKNPRSILSLQYWRKQYTTNFETVAIYDSDYDSENIISDAEIEETTTNSSISRESVVNSNISQRKFGSFENFQNSSKQNKE